MKITPINTLLSVTLPTSASNFDDGQESAYSGLSCATDTVITTGLLGRWQNDDSIVKSQSVGH